MCLHPSSWLAAACLIVPALLQDGPTEEPPLRARVTLDGEVIEVVLGTTATTADGRSLRVRLAGQCQR